MSRFGKSGRDFGRSDHRGDRDDRFDRRGDDHGRDRHDDRGRDWDGDRDRDHDGGHGRGRGHDNDRHDHSNGHDRGHGHHGHGCGEETPPPSENLCDRPLDGADVAGKIEMQDSQITALTLTFLNNEMRESGFPTPGDVSGDGYYTIQINVPAEMAEDPDAYMDELLSLLDATDGNFQEPYGDQNYYFKSVIVTDCHGNMVNYAIETDTNGEAPDNDLASGMFNDADGIFDETTDVAGHVDATYTLEFDGDAFAFV
ncbi:MAG: hypothetical protein ACK5IP_01295 [Paracoccus sp. (in: a-proteobacteria)]